LYPSTYYSASFLVVCLSIKEWILENSSFSILNTLLVLMPWFNWIKIYSFMSVSYIFCIEVSCRRRYPRIPLLLFFFKRVILRKLVESYVYKFFSGFVYFEIITNYTELNIISTTTVSAFLTPFGLLSYNQLRLK
jgi:hypothetical protein